MMRRHLEAQRFLQLMWVPRRNDRVIYKKEKHTVVGYHAARGVKLRDVDGWVMTAELFYRPTPQDAEKVLKKLKDMWVYCRLISSNRYAASVRCNGRQVHLQGRALSILSQVLNLRVVDSAVNVNINRIFEEAARQPNRSARRQIARIQGALSARSRLPSTEGPE